MQQLHQLTVTVTTLVTPTFDPITLCQNSTATALPGTSNNGITGTWSPATINTSVAGSTTYTFTPTDACATTASDHCNCYYTGDTNI